MTTYEVDVVDFIQLRCGL